MFLKTCASLWVQNDQTDGHQILGTGKEDFDCDYSVV
jgi:hypothetical protein